MPRTAARSTGGGALDGDWIARRVGLVNRVQFLLFVLLIAPVMLLPFGKLSGPFIVTFLSVFLSGLWLARMFGSVLRTRLLQAIQSQADRGQLFGLDSDRLQVADIIATSNSGQRSELIKRETQSDLSHVALYLGHDRVIEAVWPRVRVTTVNEHVLTSDRRSIRVLRIKLPPHRRSEVCKSVVDEAEFHRPALYSLARALAVKWPWLGRVALYDSTICSGLVAQGFKKAGVALVAPIVEIPTPRDILESDRVEDVTDRVVRRLPTPTGQKVIARMTMRANWSMLLAPINNAFAIVWRISPARRAWGRPMEQWNGLDVYSFWIWRELKIRGGSIRMRIGNTAYGLLASITPSQDSIDYVLEELKRSIPRAEADEEFGRRSVREYLPLRSEHQKLLIRNQEMRQHRQALEKVRRLRSWRDRFQKASQ